MTTSRKQYVDCYHLVCITDAHIRPCTDVAGFQIKSLGAHRQGQVNKTTVDVFVLRPTYSFHSHHIRGIILAYTR